jgi:16S rRNA (cytosine1402-N4)-methyltransferase
MSVAMSDPWIHQSVLLNESVDLLLTDLDGIYVDGTLGAAGHSIEILKKLSPKGRLVGLDWDPEMLGLASKRLEPYAGRYTLLESNFRDIETALDKAGIKEIDGVLLDLGISSHHYDELERGFSFQKDSPLDMRLSPSNSLTAEAIVNQWPVEQITHLLREYGEERFAYKIARAIVDRRAKGPIKTTGELRSVIEASAPRVGRIHPATRTFMALRIAVNRELENLTRGMESAAARLKKGGRLVVITFHSGEDRIVKSLFNDFVNAGGFEHATRSAVEPEADEIERNPRSRSAQLRAVTKK